jgi:hypothetical protein
MQLVVHESFVPLKDSTHNHSRAPICHISGLAVALSRSVRWLMQMMGNRRRKRSRWLDYVRKPCRDILRPCSGEKAGALPSHGFIYLEGGPSFVQVCDGLEESCGYLISDQG